MSGPSIDPRLLDVLHQASSLELFQLSTLIERPNNPSFTLDWRVADINGQPRVVDVIAEGTSLRLTTRSEYAAVIQRNSGRVASLLEAMRGQIAQLAAREGG